MKTNILKENIMAAESTGDKDAEGRTVAEKLVEADVKEAEHGQVLHALETDGGRTNSEDTNNQAGPKRVKKSIRIPKTPFSIAACLISNHPPVVPLIESRTIRAID
jgi:hypothetical protein